MRFKQGAHVDHHRASTKGRARQRIEGQIATTAITPKEVGHPFPSRR